MIVSYLYRAPWSSLDQFNDSIEILFNKIPVNKKNLFVQSIYNFLISCFFGYFRETVKVSIPLSDFSLFQLHLNPLQNLYFTVFEVRRID